MSQSALYLFGPPRLERDGVPIHIPRRKAMALLAYLAVSGQSYSRDALATLLWPEYDQSGARAELRRTLSVLKRTLGDGWLVTDRETARLELTNNSSTNDSFWLDTAAFREKLKVGEGHNHPPTVICPECTSELEAAVTLYSDEFMAGFNLQDCPSYDEWQFFQAEELRSKLASALQRLSSYYGDARQYETALNHARRWLALDLLQDVAHRQLMELYDQSGQRAAALRQYQICRQTLEDELGVTPSQETTELDERIRAKDLSAEPTQRKTLTPEPENPPSGTVTFLFTDIQGSTPLWESQPEKMAAALEIHNAVLGQAIEAHGGMVFKTVGDSLQAAFPTAPQALDAAIQGQRNLQEANWNELGELKVRMGLHTGEAELDLSGDEYAVSHTKNRAARIMSAAHGGQVLLSRETATLCETFLPEEARLRYLGEFHLKGLTRLEPIYQLIAPRLREDFPPLTTLTAIKHNLPVQLTSFIGREKEIAAICKLLSSNRLVTLTGVGGTGKTRLALKVADEVLDIYPDGAWVVELAHLTDPAMIPKTVASTLGLVEIPGKPIADSLVDYLENKHLLLVLDNCEHLLDACANLVYQILRTSPKITILTTSREIMDVTGEIPFQVPPLSMPGDEAILSVESLIGCDAVRLFVERARVVQPGFELSGENVQVVDEVVRRLDGIPLAIELAAARMRLLGVEQVAHRLSDAFRLLTGGARTVLPRHQTLRASIEWSYDLLSESERLLLMRLSVFAGSWSLGAAEMVCADEPGGTQSIRPEDVLDLLSDLVDKSLIYTVSRDEGKNRFRMLETIRQYAGEKLAQENLGNENEADTLRDRHLDYYQTLSEHAESQLRSAGRLECSQRLKIELENLRAAIDWAYKSPRRAQAGLWIVTAIGFRFLVPNGYFMDTLTWVMEGLDLTENLPDLPLLRARAYNLLGEIYENQRNYKEVLIWVEKSLPILRKMGPPAYPDLCWALWDYGIAVATMHEDYNRAFEAFDKSIDISRQMGLTGTWYLGMSLFCRTIFVPHTDELFYRFNQESRQAFKQSGDRWSVMNPVDSLGEYAEMKNDFPEALSCYEEAFRLSEEIGDQTNLSYMYLHLGRAYRKIGSFDQAIQYHADYIRLWTTMGNREAMKEGFVNLGLDWFILGRSIDETSRRVYYQRAVKLIATAEKHRSIPYTFLYDPDLLDQMLNTTHSEWGELEFQRVWEEGQAMTLKEAVAFALDSRLISNFQDI